MKHLVITLFTTVLALGLLAQEAEAKRLGGGQSFGMRRNVTPANRRRSLDQALRFSRQFLLRNPQKPA